MTKKKEMREILITYCDYCLLEIKDYSHTGTTTIDDKDLDFHSMYAGGEYGVVEETCWDKYRKKRQKELRVFGKC